MISDTVNVMPDYLLPVLMYFHYIKPQHRGKGEQSGISKVVLFTVSLTTWLNVFCTKESN